MKKGIVGAGGFGREVYWSLNPIERANTVFFVDDEYWEKYYHYLVLKVISLN
jgi:hypothetical protein